jgi:hypothetical protein
MIIRGIVGVGLASVTVGLLMGGCLPLVDNLYGLGPSSDSGSTPPETLSVNLAAPTESDTVAQGSPIYIDWTVANTSGNPAALTILVESRTDLSRAELLSDFPILGTGDHGLLTWDTADARGPYQIYAEVVAADLTRQTTAAGQITVDAQPEFEFTAPLEDSEFQFGGTALTISWIGRDESGSVEIGLRDPESEEETILLETDLEEEATAGSLEFGGQDVSDADVAVGTYVLYARATDDLNEVVLVDGPQITIIADDDDDEEEETGLVIAQPDDDVTFLTSDDPLEIEYRVNKTADVLVDVKIDTDDVHTNGNEITILNQQLVEGDTDPDIFEWDGTDAAGNPVGDAIYRLFLVVSTGSGNPETKASSDLIFRRSDEDQPLIGLTAPSAQTSVNPGDYVSIKWRDDDPNEEATIRLVIDDDSDPDADNDDQIEILADREAAPDGVQDTYAWQVPASLAAGTYYVIGYIDDGGAGNASAAPARIIVEDPTQQ